MKNKISLIIFPIFIISIIALPLKGIAQSGEMPPEEQSVPVNNDVPAESPTPVEEETFTPPSDTPTPEETPIESSSEPTPEPAPTPTPVSAGTTTAPKPKPAPKASTPTETRPTTSENIVLPSVTTDIVVPSTQENSSFSALPIFLSALALGIGGFFLLKANKRKKINPCDALQKKRNKKKIELENTTNQIAIEESVLEKIKEELDDRREEVVENIIQQGIDKTGNRILSKSTKLVMHTRESYENLTEKYEKIQNLVAVLKTKKERLTREFESLDSACKKCMQEFASSLSIPKKGQKIGLISTDSTTKIYVIRHGLTDSNKTKIINGQSIDEPIASEGIEEIRRTIKNLPDDISHVYVSSMLRAKQTAEILNEHLDLPVSYHPELREVNFGNFEGKRWKEIEQGEENLRQYLNQEYDFTPHGGESIELMKNRTMKILEEIKSKHPNKKVLIVAHGGNIRFLYHTYKKDVKFDRAANASIHEFEI